MKEIKPLKLKWETIRGITEDFRSKYVNPINLIPVPIEKIIEFKLKLQIQSIPGLKEQADMEGFLQSNLTTISIDKKTYFDDRYKFRLNYTLAHEVGHLILHAEQYKQIKFTSLKEFIVFQQNIDEDSLEWFEKQANEFAGRLLVPIDKLKELVGSEEAYYTQIVEKLKSSPEGLSNREIESHIIEALCIRIYKRFEVSKDVIRFRIRTENLKNDFKFLEIT
jgi:Zn-dependent peptidase ImmA (M78 family)